MIRPYVSQQVGSPSFGLSSFGYDIRLSAKNIKMFTPDAMLDGAIIDPASFNPEIARSVDPFKNNRGHVVMPPHSFMLAESYEEFHIPDDVMAICLGKSTYARCGLIVNVTPLEPGWRGILTLEISNTTPLPAKVIVEKGIAQLIFFRGERPLITYADRKGKYQNQTGTTYPK